MGGIKRAQKLSKLSSIKYTYFEKNRINNEVKIISNSNINKYKNIFILDDMSDTCKTLEECVKLVSNNQNNINILLTHVLNEETLNKKIKEKYNLKLHYSNTVTRNNKFNIDMINIISKYISNLT